MDQSNILMKTKRLYKDAPSIAYPQRYVMRCVTPFVTQQHTLGTIFRTCTNLFTRLLFRSEMSPDHAHYQSLRLVTKKVLDELIRGGLIETYNIVKHVTGYPPVSQTKVHAVGIEHNGTIYPGSTLVSSGTGEDYESATVRALGEFFERHALSTWSEHTLYQARISTLDDTSIFLPRAVLRPQIENYSIHWVAGIDHSSERKVFVPAQSVFLYYNVVGTDQLSFTTTTSNGAAVRGTRDGAYVQAVLELIERDAFLFYWLTKQSPRKIDTLTINVSNAQEYITAAKRAGLSLDILDCRGVCGIPVLVAVLRSVKVEDPFVRVSAVCGFNLEEDILKLLREILKWCHEPRTKKRGMLNGHAAADRAQFWNQVESLKHIEFFIDGQVVSFETYKNDINDIQALTTFSDLQQVLEREGIRLISVDITNSLTQTYGLSAVKFWSNELLDLYFFDEHINYTHPRVLRVLSNPATINTIPHPFL